ncbi:hypothetical protein NDU88_002447 [Pleurodeles waltl]|uniref:Uncharacterized protein n=1 Tax=Pleurodeles waltl TaxID=8319 RepID=A0AAV7NM22_PLEWA|nr:hypothetical protein NDU88_002447 [Pleurodeles waltl]
MSVYLALSRALSCGEAGAVTRSVLPPLLGKACTAHRSAMMPPPACGSPYCACARLAGRRGPSWEIDSFEPLPAAHHQLPGKRRRCGCGRSTRPAPGGKLPPASDLTAPIEGPWDGSFPLCQAAVSRLSRGIRRVFLYRGSAPGQLVCDFPFREGACKDVRGSSAGSVVWTPNQFSRFTAPGARINCAFTCHQFTAREGLTATSTASRASVNRVNLFRNCKHLLEQ